MPTARSMALFHHWSSMGGFLLSRHSPKPSEHGRKTFEYELRKYAGQTVEIFVKAGKKGDGSNTVRHGIC